MPNEIDIGGNHFLVAPMLGFRSWELQADILPAVSAAFAAMLGDAHSEGGKVALGDLDVASIGKAMGAFFSAMPRAKFAEITRELLSGALMDGRPLFAGGGGRDLWNTLMQGRTIDGWRLLWFAIEVTYPDFFALLPAFGARVAKPQPSEESST